MDRDSLLRLLVFVTTIGVIFGGIIIFLLMTMFKQQSEALQAAAHKVEEVKEALEESSTISIGKMDDLAKENTLKQLQEKGLVDTNKIDNLIRVTDETNSLVK